MPPPEVAAYMYDAVVALGLAMHAAQIEGAANGVHNGSRILDAMRSVQFDGASGPVAFDQTLDRSAQTIVYLLNNFVYNGAWLEERAVVKIEGAQHIDVAPTLWLGNRTHPPDDATLRSASIDRGAMGLAIPLAVGVGLVPVLWVASKRHRQRIRKSSALKVFLTVLQIVASRCKEALQECQAKLTFEPQLWHVFGTPVISVRSLELLFVLNALVIVALQISYVPLVDVQISADLNSNGSRTAYFVFEFAKGATYLLADACFSYHGISHECYTDLGKPIAITHSRSPLASQLDNARVLCDSCQRRPERGVGVRHFSPDHLRRRSGCVRERPA